MVFSTIHFASKEKGSTTMASESYWNFNTVVLDEAAQIEDSHLFIVLARCLSLNKMILVGDPMQLQPYLSNSLQQQGYGKLMMERLMTNSGTLLQQSQSFAPYIMLQVQFRMAPPLRQLVSHLYYDNRLQDSDCVLQQGPNENAKLRPLLVVNVTGSTKTFSPLHQSYKKTS